MIRLLSPSGLSARSYRVLSGGKRVTEIRTSRDDIHRDVWAKLSVRTMTDMEAYAQVQKLKKEGWKLG